MYMTLHQLIHSETNDEDELTGRNHHGWCFVVVSSYPRRRRRGEVEGAYQGSTWVHTTSVTVSDVLTCL
jgi:hypothetical protein